MQIKQLSVIILLIISIFLLKCSALPTGFCDNTEIVEFLPHPTNCSVFVICIIWLPTVIECEQGLIFDPSIWRCEPGDPDTCELFTTQPIVTTTTSITTPTITSATETTSIDPTTEPDEPESTTNNSTEYSTVPTEITTAQESTTDEISSTTTIRVSTTSSAAPPIHRCPPGGNGYIPNYTNCARYFKCISGIRNLRFCPEEKLFDSVILKCVSSELAVCARYR